MGLHSIQREFQFPELSDRLKRAIAYFLYYYDGSFNVVVSHTATPKGIHIWYYDPTPEYKYLNALRDTDLGYWADDADDRPDISVTFNWDDISIINTPNQDFESKRYTRHD